MNTMTSVSEIQVISAWSQTDTECLAPSIPPC